MPKKAVAEVPSPVLPYTELTVKGRELKLCFSYGALALGEHKFRKSGETDVILLEAWPVLSDTLNVMFLFACSLVKYQPEIGWDEAVAMVDQDTHADIVLAILEARGVSLPKAVSNPLQPAP